MKPGRTEWRLLLEPGTLVKLLSYATRNPSKVLYEFVKYDIPLDNVPIHLKGANWAQLRNSRGNSTWAMLGAVVPTNQIKDPKPTKEKQCDTKSRSTSTPRTSRRPSA